MLRPSPQTSLARLSPWVARVALCSFVLLGIFTVALSCSRFQSGFAGGLPRVQEAPSDVQLYAAEVSRIAHGESYYQAASDELQVRGYPTRNLMNWRTPLPMWLMGKLPSIAWSKALLGIGVLATMFLTFIFLAKEGSLMQGAVGCVMVFGALLPVWLGDLLVMPVLWAGTFIALSVLCYGLGSWKWGILFGLAALFFRDLAGLYCVLAIVLAITERRKEEVLAWMVGLSVYAVFLAWHALQVSQNLGPGGIAHENSWLQFGGTAFVLSAVQMNAFLLVLPQWVAALYFTAAMLGLASWNSAGGRRVTLVVAAYTILWGFVGYDFNQYWGSMMAPLFCLGAARSGAALRDLCIAGRWRQVGQKATATA